MDESWVIGVCAVTDPADVERAGRVQQFAHARNSLPTVSLTHFTILGSRPRELHPLLASFHCSRRSVLRGLTTRLAKLWEQHPGSELPLVGSNKSVGREGRGRGTVRSTHRQRQAVRTTLRRCRRPVSGRLDGSPQRSRGIRRTRNDSHPGDRRTRRVRRCVDSAAIGGTRRTKARVRPEDPGVRRAKDRLSATNA